ncbi:hypothetical protein YC2023_076731 [Brassica napus]
MTRGYENMLLFAQQIPLDELLLFYYYCCSVTEYNIKVRSWINFDTSDSSLGYSSSKHFETTMVTLALAVGVCGARAGTLNLTQRILISVMVRATLIDRGRRRSGCFLYKHEMDKRDAPLVSELVEHFSKVNHPDFYLTYQVTTMILLTDNQKGAMDSSGFSNLMSIDFESQGVVDAANAEAERTRYDGSQPSQSRRRRIR